MERNNRGFWIVAAMLFVPLIVIVVLQFTSDENRYIGPAEALDIAAEEEGLEEPPETWDLEFDRTPPRPFADTPAVWHVTAPNSADDDIDMIIDAETGKVLGRATFTE